MQNIMIIICFNISIAICCKLPYENNNRDLKQARTATAVNKQLNSPLKTNHTQIKNKTKCSCHELIEIIDLNLKM